ncbi:hypothetical protein [Halovivax limisalsi]|uniref:hypothetical protein n=1 Tax=Halovivax limisalsi TaxID=1453760 RepID=UPI001FFD6C34|nr:hypothetical protein [Halovivax limisalsi]
MTLRGRLRSELRTAWKRHVTGEPDRYQAYVSFPVGRRGATDGRVAEHVEALERVFEGRLDVYARRSRLAAVSDPVRTDRFDPSNLRTVLDRIEAAYEETHALATVTKWRSIDGRLVKSFVAVPVRPLFPPGTDPDDRPSKPITAR